MSLTIEHKTEEVGSLELYPDYRVDIGIEVHVQLNTKSKIFCSCSNAQTDTPNTHICPVCLGHPGTLPVLNKKVLESAIKIALATNSTIATKSTFARKHYFYPDLPKGYQTTQDKEPICTEGHVLITREDGTQKKIRLIRIHMEEDAGKNIHAQGSDESFVDYNRAGTPLLEIVSYPDITSIQEAQLYLKTLRHIVQYLGITTGNMEEGSFRADTNVSVRKKDSTVLGTRCELKNINSFKFIGDAIAYEIGRQIALLESGERVIQETRLWDTKRHITCSMRSKEDAADYRYFEDPDLPIIAVSPEWIEEIRAQLPELPAQKKARLQNNYKLSSYEAEILLDDTALCNYYEQAANITQEKQLINWVLRDLMGYLKESKELLETCKITPEKLASLVNLIAKGVITIRVAQEIFLDIAHTGKSPETIIKEKNLEQMGDIATLETLVQEVIAQNPESVAQYKAGKEKLLGFFIGQVMQKTQGKANPKIINDLVKKYLS